MSAPRSREMTSEAPSTEDASVADRAERNGYENGDNHDDVIVSPSIGASLHMATTLPTWELLLLDSARSRLRPLTLSLQLTLWPQGYQDTPDYTVLMPQSSVAESRVHVSQANPLHSQDSDTNPNTTASSVAGDATPMDGRKRRSEAFQLRKSLFGKKHGKLHESKVSSTVA